METAQISKEEESYAPELSLRVSPLPKTISRDELIKFFQKFGSVKKQCFIQNSLIVEYFDSEPINVLMSKSDWLPHEKLQLSRNIHDDAPRRKQRKQKKVPNNTEEQDPIKGCVFSIIGDETDSTFYDQLPILLRQIELSDTDLTTRYINIGTHLHQIFREVFPECQIYRFGSTVTGLSFKGCDLDIYMDVGKIGLPPICSKPDIPPHILTLSIFKRVRRVMYRMKSVFSNIVFIPKAKTPIIKFRYVPTDVSCDICFKNGLGIYKSNFLRYCVLRDARLRPLMMFIKYWAKEHGLTGVGKISNYGLLSLIIFYFQQESVGLIPPLIDLQKNCVPQIMNGWQINFDPNAIIPPTNNSSLLQLLHDFFFFYATFEFRSRVLCLLDGKIYSAADFIQVDRLPDYMDRYKTYVMEDSAKRLDIDKPMCVQDPIELNQNTTAITPIRIIKQFRYCCAFGAEICDTNSTSNDFLRMLFSARPSIQYPQKKHRFGNCISFNNKYLNAGLPEDFETRTDIANKWQYKRDNWFFMVFNLIKDIFKTVFKFAIERKPFGHEAKQRKIEAFSDDHTKSLQKFKFYCRGKKCVWFNRAKYNKTLLDVQLSLLEREAIVSNKVVEQSTGLEGVDNIYLEFSCTLEKLYNPLGVLYTINDVGYSDDQIFVQFESVLCNWLPNIIEKTLIHMLQYKKTYSQLLCHTQS